MVAQKLKTAQTQISTQSYPPTILYIFYFIFHTTNEIVNKNTTMIFFWTGKHNHVIEQRIVH
jgi:hypothetical protein